MLYITVAAFVGLYSHRWFAWLRPRVGDTSVHKIIVGTFFSVLISGALPIVARVLGIIRVDILALYKDTGYLKNPYFILIFKILFTALFVRRYLKELTYWRPRIRRFFTTVGEVLSGSALRVNTYKKEARSSPTSRSSSAAANGSN